MKGLYKIAYWLAVAPLISAVVFMIKDDERWFSRWSVAIVCLCIGFICHYLDSILTELRK